MRGLTLLACMVWICPCSGSDFESGARRLFRGATRNFLQPPPARREKPPAPEAGVQSRRYVVRTTDGWKLVAVRYWSSQGLDRSKPPVVLCHGFNYNGRFFDLDESLSLARYLALAGFDVWTPDLRGSGLSNKWALSAQGGADALLGRFASKLLDEEIPANGFVSLDPRYSRWTLDDHVDYDVPAILNLVKRQSGSEKLTWLGHSMGGNVMLAYLSKYGQDETVERLATVGSQMSMPDGQLFLQFLVEMIRMREMQLTGREPRVEELLVGMNRIFFNESNTDPAVVQALATTVRDMPSVGVARQYSDLATSGRLRDARKERNYADGLARITCPILIAAGGQDQIAPPSVQRHLHDAVASQDKTLLILGRQSGFRTDYGHNDSLVGRTAPSEVFPILARWLAGESIEATSSR